MPLTMGRAKEQLAQYAERGGLCPDDKGVHDFVLEVLQYVLFKGPNAALKSFCFQARRGCITIPYDLEVPLKVRMNGRVGDVWSSWFKYYDVGNYDRSWFGNDPSCMPADRALTEIPGHFPTVYQVPEGGSKIGVLGIVDEACDAHLIVKGVDPTGREIFSFQDGQQVSGEYLTIQKGKINYTTFCFAKITDIVKTKTNGPAVLYAVDPDKNYRYFLSEYTALEEIPQYKRFKLELRCRENAEIDVMGRIRLRENYHDTDVLPVDNILLLKTAAQGIQLGHNMDYQGFQIKNVQVEGLVDDENRYKKVSPGQPIDMYDATSPGAISGIVRRRGSIWGRRFR